MVTFRRQKPAGSSFHEYTRQVPGRVGSLLAWIMRKCGTKLCHILQQVSLYVARPAAPHRGAERPIRGAKEAHGEWNYVAVFAFETSAISQACS